MIQYGVQWYGQDVRVTERGGRPYTLMRALEIEKQFGNAKAVQREVGDWKPVDMQVISTGGEPKNIDTKCLGTYCITINGRAPRCADHPEWEPMHLNLMMDRFECHSGWEGSGNGREGLKPCTQRINREDVPQ